MAGRQWWRGPLRKEKGIRDRRGGGGEGLRLQGWRGGWFVGAPGADANDEQRVFGGGSPTLVLALNKTRRHA